MRVLRSLQKRILLGLLVLALALSVQPAEGEKRLARSVIATHTHARQILVWRDDVVLVANPGLVDGKVGYGVLPSTGPAQLLPLLRPYGEPQAFAQQPDGVLWVLVRAPAETRLLLRAPLSGDPRPVPLPTLASGEQLLRLFASADGPILLTDRQIARYSHSGWTICRWSPPETLGGDRRENAFVGLVGGRMLLACWDGLLEWVDLTSGERVPVPPPGGKWSPGGYWSVFGIETFHSETWVLDWFLGLIKVQEKEPTIVSSIAEIAPVISTADALALDKRGEPWIVGRTAVGRYTRGKFQKEFDVPKGSLFYSLRCLDPGRLLMGGTVKLTPLIVNEGWVFLATRNRNGWNLEKVELRGRLEI